MWKDWHDYALLASIMKSMLRVLNTITIMLFLIKLVYYQ
ncbi:hypothetical protein yrohd0001_24390 [Yersinia rohdei ATCC 43380]|nr:hypothetical protein yrohd0001_24390 [Yersinia rohdei ATCC 43380]